MEKARETLGKIRRGVKAVVAPEGAVDPALMEERQHAAHGFAWEAAAVAALKQSLDWAERLERKGGFLELEQLILPAAFSQRLRQICGGSPMSQGEYAHLAIRDRGAPADALAPRRLQKAPCGANDGRRLWRSGPTPLT